MVEGFRKRSILRRLELQRGASPEARERLKQANEAAKDWRGRCRKCGAELEGTLAELRGHVCAADT